MTDERQPAVPGKTMIPGKRPLNVFITVDVEIWPPMKQGNRIKKSL